MFPSRMLGAGYSFKLMVLGLGRRGTFEQASKLTVFPRKDGAYACPGISKSPYAPRCSEVAATWLKTVHVFWALENMLPSCNMAWI